MLFGWGWRGGTETKLALVKQNLAGQKELMVSYLEHVCGLPPLLEESFSRRWDHSLSPTKLKFVQCPWFIKFPR